MGGHGLDFLLTFGSGMLKKASFPLLSPVSPALVQVTGDGGNSANLSVRQALG